MVCHVARGSGSTLEHRYVRDAGRHDVEFTIWSKVDECLSVYEFSLLLTVYNGVRGTRICEN